MNKIIRLILSSTLFLCSASVLACDYPARALIPNGSTASKDEMIDVQRDVKKYVADMEAYLECIVEEEKIARNELGNLEADQEQEREDLLNKKYNAAVDEMERLVAQFNLEVQEYKAQETG